MKARWRNKDSFPPSGSTWSVLAAPFHFKRSGEIQVRAALKRALPLNPVLVSTPETNRYLPPILIDPEEIAPRIARNSRIIFRIMVLYFFIFVGATLFLGDLTVTIIMGLTFLALSLQAHDMRTVSSSLETLRERWMFYGWCSAYGTVYGLGFMGFMVLLAAVQLALIQHFGTQSALLEAYGLRFNSFETGEYWRVISAPFLHVDAGHWIVNAAVGTGILFATGPVCGGLLTCVVLLLGNVVGLGTLTALDPLVQWEHYGIVGFSGGISACYGILLGASIRHPELFPDRFSKSLILASITILVATSAVTNIEGTVGHMIGFVLGFCVAFLKNPVSTRFADHQDI